jgi:hypothetical protein
MLRLARQWDGPTPQAVAFLRRPDVLVGALSSRGGPLAAWLMLDKRLRQRPEGASATLPPGMLLVLDFSQTLHLVAVEDDFLLRASKTVVEWPPGEATVRVLPDSRGMFCRPVEIADGSRTLLVAGAWATSRQRAALELIERVAKLREQFGDQQSGMPIRDQKCL